MIFGAVTIYTSVQGFKERAIGVLTSNGMIGEVASLAHSTSGSILQALTVTSSRRCLSCRRRSRAQGEVDPRSSAQPVANVPVTYNPSFNPKR
jgi:hypothetical protein